jgi:hypothetical protein
LPAPDKPVNQTAQPFSRFTLIPSCESQNVN